MPLHLPAILQANANPLIRTYRVKVHTYNSALSTKRSVNEYAQGSGGGGPMSLVIAPARHSLASRSCSSTSRVASFLGRGRPKHQDPHAAGSSFTRTAGMPPSSLSACAALQHSTSMRQGHLSHQVGPKQAGSCAGIHTLNQGSLQARRAAQCWLRPPHPHLSTSSLHLLAQPAHLRVLRRPPFAGTAAACSSLPPNTAARAATLPRARRPPRLAAAGSCS